MLKRLITIILLLLWSLSITGCSKEEQLLSPVAYYYLQVPMQFNGSDSVIHAEMREAAGFENNFAYLLRVYLLGPNSSEYQTPFPNDIKLVSLTYDDTTLVAVFSEEFATLFGLDLTLACVCFGRTAMELTGAPAVRIQTERGLLNGKASITIDHVSVHYFDDYYLQTE